MHIRKGVALAWQLERWRLASCRSCGVGNERCGAALCRISTWPNGVPHCPCAHDHYRSRACVISRQATASAAKAELNHAACAAPSSYGALPFTPLRLRLHSPGLLAWRAKPKATGVKPQCGAQSWRQNGTRSKGQNHTGDEVVEQRERINLVVIRTALQHSVAALQ